MCHVPSVAAAVEAFFASRDLAAGTCPYYRQAPGPLVEAVGADRPVTDLCPDRGGGCVRGVVGRSCAGDVEHPAVAVLTIIENPQTRSLLSPSSGELEVLASVSAPGWAGPHPARDRHQRPTVRVGSGHSGHPRSRVAATSKQVGSSQPQSSSPGPSRPATPGECPAPERHNGECGPVAARLHRARRADDLDYRRRVIDAKQRQPSATPPATPGHARPRPGRTRPPHRHAPADDRRDRRRHDAPRHRARPGRGDRSRRDVPDHKIKPPT